MQAGKGPSAFVDGQTVMHINRWVGEYVKWQGAGTKNLGEQAGGCSSKQSRRRAGWRAGKLAGGWAVGQAGGGWGGRESGRAGR